MIRTLVVHHSDIALDIIKEFLQADDEFVLIGTAKNSHELMESLHTLSPDLIIINTAIGREGLISHIHKICNAVIILTGNRLVEPIHNVSRTRFFVSTEFSSFAEPSKLKRTIYKIKQFVSHHHKHKNSSDQPYSVQENIDIVAGYVANRSGIQLDNNAKTVIFNYLQRKYPDNNIVKEAETLLEKESIYGLANYFTISETSFFREEAHFDAVFNYLLPRYAQLHRVLNICCVGCSTGCESYSLAALIEYYNKQHNQLFIRYTIDAFDINEKCIAIAQAGHYTTAALHSGEFRYNRLLCEYTTPTDDGFTVNDYLRSKVRFFTRNVLDGFTRHYDIIFFKNTLMYFTHSAFERTMHLVFDSLTDDGFLFTGTSEDMLVNSPLFTRRRLSNAFVFQKKRFIMPASSNTREFKFSNLPLAFKTLDTNTITQMLLSDDTKGDHERYRFNTLAARAVEELTSSLDHCNATITELESLEKSSITLFLRAEYLWRKNCRDLAKEYYELSMYTDDGFWPALYRLVTLIDPYENSETKFRINLALANIKNGYKHGYEVYLGGFLESDYTTVLERRLAQPKRELECGLERAETHFSAQNSQPAAQNKASK